MKKIFYHALVLSLTILLSPTAHAQGIYQLWGMTAGGTDDIGVVFRADGEGNNAQGIYSFPRTNLGAAPMYNQLTEYKEKFYSMTSAGGANNLGVIFEWDPVSNIYIKKYDFENANGDKPHGSLVLMGDKFYGMTNTGGSNNLGVIFEWDPATNIYSKKYDFDSINGSNPYGSLLLNEGKFYGMTYSGGTNNLGVIFEWDPIANAFEKKYDFDGFNGSNPYGDLAFYNGKLYGMTSSGGSGVYGRIVGLGVIFEWDPVSNIYTKKFDLDHGTGRNPFGTLVLVNDKFFGITYNGNSVNGEGGLFEWDPVSNIFTQKIAFYDFSGNPRCNPVLNNGKLYGLTYTEFRTKGFARGFLFEFDPATGIYTEKYDFLIRVSIDNSYNGSYPWGSMVSSGGKLYGMTRSGGSSGFVGGSSGAGVIFEFDPAGAGTYTKKISFNHVGNGASPNSFVFHKGHLYGITENGGIDGMGVIFEWDFVNNKFIKKHEFDGITGGTPTTANTRYPTGKLTLYNGKFYGMTSYPSAGGPIFQGHIFEWDPVTNEFVQKTSVGTSLTGDLIESGGKLYGVYRYGGPGIFEWDPATNLMGSYNGIGTVSGLAENAGKLYGMAVFGGTNNAGFIFEFDVLTKIDTKRHDFDILNGATPTGSLILHQGIYYGVTSSGGSNGLGVIFEWDHVDNKFTKKYDFDAATGSNPSGSLVLNNGKFYGMTSSGGANNLGVIFEWDPVTNIYTKKSDFTGDNGRNPISKNSLTVVPALAARGVPNSCITYSPVIIDNSNNNSWVPIIDNDGFAIAEINSNGNNLGIVNASFFINNNLIREDGDRRLYLDRNITITPQSQPSSPVDIRLYIRGAEFETIKNAVNSIGDASNIEAINELGIFKNDDNCGSSVIRKASLVSTTGAKWETDYVLSASVTNFSTFYFANKANVALPLTLLEFSGRLQNNNALLNWKTENEINTLEFVIERSIDGNQYKAVGTVASANRPGMHGYSFTDPGINMIGAKIIYYRLQQKDIDGQFVYSKIVPLSVANENTIVKLYPNPVNNELKLSINAAQRHNIQLKIIDASGRTINHQTRQLTTGSNSFTIDVTKIANGVYYLNIQGNGVNKWMQFVKQ